MLSKPIYRPLRLKHVEGSEPATHVLTLSDRLTSHDHNTSLCHLDASQRSAESGVLVMNLRSADLVVHMGWYERRTWGEVSSGHTLLLLVDGSQGASMRSGLKE